MSEQNDTQLLAAARAGDRPSLEALLRRYEAHIYRFGLRMCGHPEDAKDVLQDTLFAMARRIGDLRGAAALPTWLYTVARSFCLKRRRRGKFAPAAVASLDAAAEDGVQVADAGRGPEERVAGRELQTALAAAIASLPQAQREVLILRDIEGLDASHVAEVLGIRVAAVKSRLHRARLTLRAQLAPALGGEVEPTAGRGCPDVLTLWSRHLEGEITADVCARMERHLAVCPRCTAACDSLKRSLALCQSAPAPRVPAPVQRQVRAKLHRLLAEA